MTGREFRSKLVLANAQVTELARAVGISHQSLSQALSSKDVKSGLIEKTASALNLPISFFYGEQGEDTATSDNININKKRTMTGSELRSKLFLTKKPLTEIAASIGMSSQGLSQALKVKDVKTGFVEKLAAAVGLPLSFFYGDSEDCATGCQQPSSTATLMAENKLLREQVGFLQEQVRTMLSIMGKQIRKE